MQGKRLCNRNSAFTLIELLVVIAIIAILAAILFPVFAQAREKARQTACLSNLKQIGLGLTQYQQDYDETNPPAFNGVGFGGGGWPGTQRWMDLIYPYVKNEQLFTCPSDPDPVPYQYQPLTDPDQYKSVTFCGSYGINNAYWCENEWGCGEPNGVQTHGPQGQPISAIARPADTIFVAERRAYFVPPGGGGDGWGIAEIAWANQNDGAATFYQNLNPQMLGAMPARHVGGSNLAFCDGHAKWFKHATLARVNQNGVRPLFTIEDD